MDRATINSVLKQREDGPSGLAPLFDLVRDDMARVDDTIMAQARCEVTMIPDIAGYLIESGGKRLRPMLTIAAARMCGYHGDRHIELAAAVEFMHTATLLHDDVVDESGLRRGKRAARMIWGNQASVLVGDYLLGQAFRMMVETRSLAALGILSNAAAIIAEGEVMQLAAQRNIETAEATYLRIIEAKTAALFSAAVESGAALAQRSRAEHSALRSYGRNLGLAFQLIDDALDYAGQPTSLGKAIGDDFREGKATLPVILACQRGDHKERAFWARALRGDDPADSDFDRAIALIRKHGAIDDTIRHARSYGDLAHKSLGRFSRSEHKYALGRVVDFCIDRAG
ncbi:MAG: polyprenyl synthetase family protein [Hyphomicrobiales bacterium]